MLASPWGRNGPVHWMMAVLPEGPLSDVGRRFQIALESQKDESLRQLKTKMGLNNDMTVFVPKGSLFDERDTPYLRGAKAEQELARRAQNNPDDKTPPR